METTQDILNQFKELYKSNKFRYINGDIKTVEIQNAHFVADKDYIIREPNYDYANCEIRWYDSMSLYVKDISNKVPIIWQNICDVDGKINSNYGWCIYSEENYSQYNNCLYTLLNDSSSRQGVMIYNRPSMQIDAYRNHMKDFMCTYAVQCFLNENEDGFDLKYIVYQRSSDAVFGFNNDHLWHKEVQKRLASDLENKMNKKINCLPIEFNCGSIHVYERHFKYLQ